MLIQEIHRPTLEDRFLHHRYIRLQSCCYGHPYRFHCLSSHRRTPEHGAYGDQLWPTCDVESVTEVVGGPHLHHWRQELDACVILGIVINSSESYINKMNNRTFFRLAKVFGVTGRTNFTFLGNRQPRQLRCLVERISVAC